MKLANYHTIKRYTAVSIGLVIVLLSCRSAEFVDFKTPVDTTTRQINLQTKKIFYISDLGIYVSNQFDGARLNNVKKLNEPKDKKPRAKSC